jgi:hypothetical protein
MKNKKLLIAFIVSLLLNCWLAYECLDSSYRGTECRVTLHNLIASDVRIYGNWAEHIEAWAPACNSSAAVDMRNLQQMDVKMAEEEESVLKGLEDR